MIDLATTVLGVPVMDYQHRSLLELINLLGTGGDNTGVIAGFQAYAERHFVVEESLMEAYGYPGRDEHVAAHDAYRKRFAGLLAPALSGSPVLTRTMHRFLEQWWVEHIGHIDRELADFLRSKGIREAA